MRVLALENELTSMRGGQEISLLDVCRGLAGRGHPITLAYVTSGDLEEEYRRICQRVVRVRTYSIDRSRTLMSPGSRGGFTERRSCAIFASRLPTSCARSSGSA